MSFTGLERYVVRKDGLYVCDVVQDKHGNTLGCGWTPEQKDADAFLVEFAREIAEHFDARVSRVLTRKEAQDRKAAKALREHAALCRVEAKVWAAMKSVSAVSVAHTEGIGRGHEKAAEFADRQADALWKRRGK